MKFSQVFEIQRMPEDDWFDPILSVDTQLFIDPFLLYDSEAGLFVGSHEQVIRFFSEAYKLIAQSAGNTSSQRYRKALTILLFPEAQELCLGYASTGTRGFGSGKGFAKIIAAAVWEAIRAGVDEITHFEEVGIFREGIGADRTSDITACLLRKRLADYTLEVCLRHNVPTQVVNFRNGIFDPESVRWQSISVRLPINSFTGKPILLVPRYYLRDLPTINADDFWDFCYTNDNETLRNEFNFDISKRVTKANIVEVARRHPDLRSRYLEEVEKQQGMPYDMYADPKGYVQWYEASLDYCTSHSLPLAFVSSTDFNDSIYSMVGAYKHFIEQNGGWQLLWNDHGPSKGEKAAQLLFLGIVSHYCRANNIDVSPEPNIGRGPVDFKMSQGYQFRTLLEVKLARNTKFWNGLNKQLPTYLEAEQVHDGYFIVVIFNEADVERTKEIGKLASKLNNDTGYNITPVVVDARPKISASKL